MAAKATRLIQDQNLSAQITGAGTVPRKANFIGFASDSDGGWELEANQSALVEVLASPDWELWEVPELPEVWHLAWPDTPEHDNSTNLSSYSTMPDGFPVNFKLKLKESPKSSEN